MRIINSLAHITKVQCFINHAVQIFFNTSCIIVSDFSLMFEELCLGFSLQEETEDACDDKASVSREGKLRELETAGQEICD